MGTPVRDFNRWVILRLRLFDDAVWVEYRDEVGTERRVNPHARSGEWVLLPIHGPLRLPPPQAAIDLGLGNLPYGEVWVPHDLDDLLHSGWADFEREVRWHLGPGSQGSMNVPWLLPIFIEPPYGLELVLWEAVLEAAFDKMPDQNRRCVLVRMGASRPARTQPPLKLPLVLRDESDPPVDLLAPVRNHHWYTEDMQLGALRCESARGALPVSGAPARKTAPAQVRVTRGVGDPMRWPTGCQLELAFVTAPLVEALSAAMQRRPPAASWLGCLTRAEVDEDRGAVDQVVYALAHDFALHEVLWLLRKIYPQRFWMLLSDPQANQGLRLSRVMRALVDQVDAISLTPDDLQAFTTALRSAREQARALAFRFDKETMGLTDLARFVAHHLRPLETAVPLTAAGWGPSEPEERRADVAIERYDEFGVLRPLAPQDRQYPLEAGWRYRLRVDIGTPDPERSAIDGKVPAIDPLLPVHARERMVRIDVVVFEKRFGLLSPAMRTLELPPYGASLPVYFELRAPLKSGPADLRIALYLEDNLLQSFVLAALIAPKSERFKADSVLVSVRLASSGSQRFDNLDIVGRRSLSVALNDDAGGTHTIMLKRGGRRGAVTLTETQAATYMEEFRDLIAGASLGQEQGQRLFPVKPAQIVAAQRQAFEAKLRDLARLGHGIWHKLIEAGLGDRGELAELRASDDLPVQFVRHGSGLPFPWQTVYDYRVPEGDAPFRVCYGDTPVEKPVLGALEFGCPHCPGERVVCVRGFWSVRHRIEQLSEDRLNDDGSASDRVVSIRVPKANPVVCLGVGVPDLATQALTGELESKLKANLKVLGTADPRIEELLWDESKRPGVLIVLGHLEPADQTRNLPIRIGVIGAGGSNILTDTGLRQMRAARLRWESSPRPLVLLMACGSARSEVAALTSLLDTVLSSGAAGAAGTEADVYSDLAADFACHLVLGLVKRKEPLGVLLREYYMQMMAQANPLAFAFTVYGPAELAVERSEHEGP